MNEPPSSSEMNNKPNTRRQRPSWYASLSSFQNPSIRRGTWQVLNTVVPYLALWFLMIFSIQGGYPIAVTVVLEVIAAAFLVRIFILFHDCVHGSLFPSKNANTFLGHIFGVLTFTPFDDWRFSHLRHHATCSDLDARGIGDIWTMTKTEYETASKGVKLCYRIYRNPIVLVGFGALFTFLILFRLPTSTSKRKERMSVLLTNLLIVGVALGAASCIGWKTYLIIQIPVVWMAGAAGIWLFYVQHQFEGGYWARKNERDSMRAAIEGSSFYRLPAVLRWFSGNIGYHHIHHLNARIPNYRLKDCHEAIPELKARPALTIRKSLAAGRIKLWDEAHKKLVGFDCFRKDKTDGNDPIGTHDSV